MAPFPGRRSILAAMALLAAGAAPLPAQRITGTVRDRVSRMPIPGAVITMSDGAGRTLRQLITDTAGRFGASVPPGRVRVRVLRIGFRPVQRTVEAAAGGTTAIDLAMPEISIVLEAVHTSGEKICGDAARQGGAAAELWQQARAGLLATVVARRAVPAAVRVLSFRQVFDADGRRLLHQRAFVASGTSQRPFGAAASARDFERTGFVVDADDGRTYYAPDADVLLDPQFAANHCFSVTTDARRHPDEIGLAFEPAKNAPDKIVDVAGTLWLRSGSPELRSMEFGYVRIEDAARDAGAGGTIDFSTMPNGVVVLSRWELTAPVLRRRRSYAREPGGRQYDVTEVQHIGGILADASWPGGLHWHGPVGTLVGRVVRGDADTPARRVRVWLDATQDTVLTDADGRFTIADLLPGRYRLHAEDPALVRFRAEPPLETDVAVPPRADSLPPIALRSYDDIERRLCQGERVDSQTTVLLGTLTEVGREPRRPVDLQLTWPAGGTSEGARTSGAHGRFYLCDPPRRRVISVRALRDRTVWLDTVVRLPDAPVGMVALSLAARGAASATGTVVGFVRDSAGAPLAMATAVPPDGAASLSVPLRRVTVLPTVTARAAGAAAMPDYHGIHKFDLFYRRRASGSGGQFFTHDQIEQRAPARLSDLLEGKAARLPRCRNAQSIGGEPAYQLFIDDLPYGSFGLDAMGVLDAIPPWEVEGLEIYTSVSELPVEAMGNGCAAIFVWLRSTAADSSGR